MNSRTSNLDINTSSFSDHFLLLFIATIGFAGSIYLFSSWETDESTPQITAINNSMLMANSVTAEQFEFEDKLTIIGKPEVGQKMKFELVNHAIGSRFLFDFGNGVQRIIDQTPLEYTYKHEGTYNLRLQSIRSNRVQTICTKTIEIKDNRQLTLNR